MDRAGSAYSDCCPAGRWPDHERHLEGPRVILCESGVSRGDGSLQPLGLALVTKDNFLVAGAAAAGCYACWHSLVPQVELAIAHACQRHTGFSVLSGVVFVVEAYCRVPIATSIRLPSRKPLKTLERKPAFPVQSNQEYERYLKDLQLYRALNHNPRVGGSSPSSATNDFKDLQRTKGDRLDSNWDRLDDRLDSCSRFALPLGHGVARHLRRAETE